MIRHATTADAPGIAQVHVESWKVIYGGHHPDEYLDSLSPEQRAPSRDEGADDAAGELTAMYLKPSIPASLASSVNRRCDAVRPDNG